MKIVGGVNTADLIMRKTPLNGLKSSLLSILSNQGDGVFDTLSSSLSFFNHSGSNLVMISAVIGRLC